MEREICWDIVDIVETVDSIGNGIAAVVVIVQVVLDCWWRFNCLVLPSHLPSHFPVINNNKRQMFVSQPKQARS